MKKSVNPRAVEITRRFFEALSHGMASDGNGEGLKGFCAKHGLNRVKYATLKMDINKPIDEMKYKCIDVDALAALCTDFGVSSEWLLLGKGQMLNPKKQ